MIPDTVAPNDNDYISQIPDHDSEASVLGAIFINPDCLPEVQGILSARDFSRARNRLIYRAMLKLNDAGTPPDQVLVARALHEEQNLEACGGIPYIGQLIASTPTSVNVEHYARAVAEGGAKRQLSNISQQIYGLANDPNLTPAEALERAHATLNGFDAPGTPSRPISTPIGEWLSMAETGYWHLPYIAPSGLLTVLVGSPKSGKSTLIFAMLAEAIHEGQALGVPCLRDLRVDILTEERQVSMIGLVNRVGLPPLPDNWHVVAQHETGASLKDVMARLSGEWLERGEPDILIIDTIGGWVRGTDWSDYGEVVDLFDHLRAFAANWPRLAILITHHTRKTGGRTAASASLGSQAFTGAADNAVLLDEVDANDETLRRLTVYGRLLPDEPSIDVRWEPDIGRYVHEKRETRSEQITTVLSLHTVPLTIEEIANQIPDATQKHVQNAISKMTTLTRTGEGKRGNPHRYVLNS